MSSKKILIKPIGLFVVLLAGVFTGLFISDFTLWNGLVILSIVGAALALWIVIGIVILTLQIKFGRK